MLLPDIHTNLPINSLEAFLFTVQQKMFGFFFPVFSYLLFKIDLTTLTFYVWHYLSSIFGKTSVWLDQSWEPCLVPMLPFLPKHRHPSFDCLPALYTVCYLISVVTAHPARPQDPRIIRSLYTRMGSAPKIHMQKLCLRTTCWYIVTGILFMSLMYYSLNVSKEVSFWRVLSLSTVINLKK